MGRVAYQAREEVSVELMSRDTVRGRRAMATPDALLGTWKMVSWTKKVVATGETSDAFGPDPVGYIS